MSQITLFQNRFPILEKHSSIPESMRSINDLPDELLAEILKLLPVKYILRCRGVQKSWYYLVGSEMFISLQLNYQKIRNDHYPKYLFFENSYTDVLTLRYDDVQCEEYCRPKYPPGLTDKSAWRAVSYGLICVSTMIFEFHESTKEIYLWNPLVEKYKTLPDSPLLNIETRWNTLAFGFVPEINDYVVVHVVKPRLHLGRGEPDPHSVIIAVYSLNTNSWKKICHDKVFVRHINWFDVVFINGAAFWAGIKWDRRKIILCYDTKTEKLREISLPSYSPGDHIIHTIHQLGQSIAYFVWDKRYDYFDMWVLKFYSIDEFSWEKKMSIRPNKDIRVEVMGVRNNGEPILARSFNLITYNLDNHMAKNFVDSWDSWTPYPYYEEDFAPPFFIRPFVESLVLLNID
ncbi:putative F-box protein At5g62660 [Daucus carota subsp. sativus]|uniref:putative F-box protein At5g62660 n=1 Tax=Daucus carota subsp. sativus TaxID=79200 RepID=UPI0007EF6414|nr:PREDICTED: putative F-box protein At5g62660 [Daucus carota subsp. sativus]